jgi:sodium/potassium-transporting ATPase subunit alpha
MVPVLCNLAFGFPTVLPALSILCIDLGTELAPAVSLAYETAEGDIMQRPPRNPTKDRLVSSQVAIYMLLQAGVIQCGLCFLNFFLVLNYYGIPASAIPFSSDVHFIDDSDCTRADNCVIYSGDRVITLQQQRDWLNAAQTAYWATLTGSQVIHIFLNKTRRVSVFSHGLTSNPTMIYGVIIEIALIVLLIYVPFLQDIIGLIDFPGQFWAIVLIPWLLLFLINEPKKWYARKYPHSFISRWLTY